MANKKCGRRENKTSNPSSPAHRKKQKKSPQKGQIRHWPKEMSRQGTLDQQHLLRRCALAGTSASPQNASTGVSGFIDFPAARRVSGLVQFFTGQFLICTQTPAGLDAAPPILLPWPPKTTNVLYGVGSKPWNF